MESRWRLNVPDLGWSQGPYTLIARLTGSIPPLEGFVARQPSLPTFRIDLFRVAGSGDIPIPIAATFTTLPFPFGAAVDPDH